MDLFFDFTPESLIPLEISLIPIYTISLSIFQMWDCCLPQQPSPRNKNTIGLPLHCSCGWKSLHFSVHSRDIICHNNYSLKQMTTELPLNLGIHHLWTHLQPGAHTSFFVQYGKPTWAGVLTLIRVVKNIYLHNDMMLSILGPSPHGCALGLHPKRPHTNGNITYSYKLSFSPPSFRYRTVLCLNNPLLE